MSRSMILILCFRIHGLEYVTGKAYVSRLFAISSQYSLVHSEFGPSPWHKYFDRRLLATVIQ